MIKTQRLGATLTSLDTALGLLLDGVKPVARSELPIGRSPVRVLGDFEPSDRPLPSCAAAAVDGWALRADDLVGASSYSPVPLMTSPTWVEVGDRIADGCDCVLDADLVDQSGPIAQAIAEATPGQGVCRVGELMATGSRAMSLIAARSAGYRAPTRPPQVCIVDVPSGVTITCHLIATLSRAAGATVILSTANARDAASIGKAIDVTMSDLLLLVGGTGVGRTDASADALAARGSLRAHGIATAPGRTSAIGNIKGMPVIAIPGMPDQALAAWLMLAKPVLDRLSGRRPPPETMLPLARKISSAIGVADIVLLKRMNDCWMPLMTGALSLDRFAEADAWVVVPAGSEGYPPGETIGGILLAMDDGHE